MFKKKLPPEFKARWLAALRSGEYKQGRGQLHADDQFCCLGVAVDLYLKDTNKQWREKDTGIFTAPSCSAAMPDYEDIPTDVYVAFNQETGDENLPIVMHTIACMNDNGTSFSAVADWIEENL